MLSVYPQFFSSCEIFRWQRLRVGALESSEAKFYFRASLKPDPFQGRPLIICVLLSVINSLKNHLRAVVNEVIRNVNRF